MQLVSAMALAGRAVTYAAPPLYEYESGRCMFQEDGITGLNRIPIGELAGYILAGASFTDTDALPLAPESVAATALIDGSWLDVDGEVQTNIIGATQTKVEQYIAPDDQLKAPRVRVWEKTPTGWSIQDYYDYGMESQREVGTKGSAADALVKYHFNPLSPAGVLYPARKTYARLEELAELIRAAQRGPGAKTAIGGFVRNRNLVEGDLMSDKPYFFTGSDQPLDRMTSTAVVDQLISEVGRLEPKYYQQVHIVDTTGPVQRPSGEDRAQVLGPMFRYVDYARKQVTAILDLYGAAWTFERIHTTSVAERTAELELLIRRRDLGALDAKVFLSQVMEL